MMTNEAQTGYNGMETGSLAQRAAILGKWLWILFWLVVPAEIAGIMKNQSIQSVAPGIYLTGGIIGAACSIAYGAILLRLSPLEGRYRIAGICSLITAVTGILLFILFGTSKAPAWSMIITLPALVVDMVGSYHEISAHSSVLIGVDYELSEKWDALWKWYVRCMACFIGSILLMLIVPVLGAILLLAAFVGILIVSIVKLVYLYRTAKVFRRLSTEVIAANG